MRTRTIALVLVISASAAGILTAGHRMSYIYKRGDNSISRMSGTVDEVVRITRRYKGEFIWVRLDGANYLIRDAATLAEARAAFREMEALEPSLREVERRLKPLEDQLDEIEDRVDEADRLDDEDLSDAEREKIERKVREAELDMREIEAKMRPIEREQERLEREEERREKIAEAAFEKIVERAIARGLGERVD